MQPESIKADAHVVSIDAADASYNMLADFELRINSPGFVAPLHERHPLYKRMVSIAGSIPKPYFTTNGLTAGSYAAITIVGNSDTLEADANADHAER